MDNKNYIKSRLISSRNFLLNGTINQDIIFCLKDILDHIEYVAIKSSQNIFKYSINLCLEFIEKKDYLNAGLILNIVHNFPLDNDEKKAWDIRYFMSIEIPEFIESTSTSNFSVEVVLYICNQLFNEKEKTVKQTNLIK